MSSTAQLFISGVEQSHFAEYYQFLVMINPFIAEKAILEKHKIVWKALTKLCDLLRAIAREQKFRSVIINK